MTLESVMSTIRQKVNETFPSPIVVFYDNAPAQERPDALHIRASIRLGSQTQVETGSPKRFRQVGILFLEIFSPIGSGDQSSIQKIDTALGVFRCKTYDGVTFVSPDLDVVGQNDRWWQVNAACSFYVDFIS